MTWREFIRSPAEVLAAVDFFTAEVWTAIWLTTYYVLTVMRVATQRVCIARITTSPDEEWMEQMARNKTMADAGFLGGCQYLLRDRDAKFSGAFDGIKAVKLPPRSPNLNAHLERWNRSVREECLSKMIPFGGRSRRHVLSSYVTFFHPERNHQGKGNVILFPTGAERVGEDSGAIQTRARLGLLKFHHREAL